jgi:hypothetical protein
MKKIATIAAIAAFTTLAACSKEEAPAEAPATEAPAGADNGATTETGAESEATVSPN